MKSILISFLLFMFLGSLTAQTTLTLTPEIKKEVVKSLVKELADNYLFADTARMMGAYLTRQLESGAYDTIQNPKYFGRKIT